VLVLDKDNWKLYEIYRAFTIDGVKAWNAYSGSVFDLKNPKPRPAGWTSADAAGYPFCQASLATMKFAERRSSRTRFGLS